MVYITIIAFAAAFVAFLSGLKRDLMMLQQNSYRADRYKRWMAESGDSTNYVRLIAWIVFFAGMLRPVSTLAASLIIIPFAAIATYMLARKKYKKPLVFTNRAKRIYATSILLSLVICAVACLSLGGHTIDGSLRTGAVAYIGLFAVSYAVTMAANWLLKPVEKSINKKYYDEAASMLRSMPGLKIIGITGSYGKTSTKHYLNRILSEQYEVLMTPGNFNTTLGVIRTVREMLKPYHQVFIVEMGAKQLGDIKEICDLVHPEAGIVTAVGPMHLESFKTIENVQRTKFELIDSLPADGLGVVNNDFEYIANRKVDNVKCRRYSVDSPNHADYYASDIKYDTTGTTFTINNADGPVLTLHTRLVGSCNVSNLIAAAIVAIEMGVSNDKIRYAVERIEQVEHRLNMKHVPGGVNIIDDAYNSNPVGSRMALEVLGAIPEGTKFVITPGMVELGDDQFDLNENLGKEIAKHADIAIIVGEYNKEAILKGIADIGMPKECVRTAATFAEAQALMLSMAKPGDTVLYENDLPDTFK